MRANFLKRKAKSPSESGPQFRVFLVPVSNAGNWKIGLSTRLTQEILGTVYHKRWLLWPKAENLWRSQPCRRPGWRHIWGVLIRISQSGSAQQKPIFNSNRSAWGRSITTKNRLFWVDLNRLIQMNTLLSMKMVKHLVMKKLPKKQSLFTMYKDIWSFHMWQR